MNSSLDSECVARVDTARKFGTGVLVSPHYLLTCAHVVTGFDPLKPHAGGLRDIAKEIGVYFPALGGRPEEQHSGTVIRTSERDLALIHLDAPCNRSQAAFYRPANPWILQSPDYAERSVVGFDSAESRTPRVMTFAASVAYKFDLEHDTLHEFQIAGGISNVMSGSPLLARAFDSTICLGIVYLGGPASATSRFLAPSAILAFLDELKLDAEFKGPWSSSQEIATPAHLGALIRMQRAKQLVTSAELALRLGIDDAVLANWEGGIEPVPATAEDAIRSLLVEGDPPALDAWLRLSGRSDLLLELQPLISRDAFCGFIESKHRGFSPSSPRPTRLREGTSVNFQIHLPAAYHLAFINVAKLETFPRFYALLGSRLLSAPTLGPGDYFLPEGGNVTVQGPPGHNCLVMLGSSESCPDPWAGCREFETEPLEGARFDRLTAIFRSLPPKNLLVAISHYEVY